jgi:ABC-type transport system involved in multi-copper enzyme maturation permease subunit
MLGAIIQFELKYRFQRPATYIYFAVMLLMAFLALAVEEFTVGGGSGQIKDNAPAVLTTIMLTLMALPGFLIGSAVMGVPILRDFEHQTGPMFFTAPIKKRDYLFGRFIGSWLITLFIFSGILIGAMLGAAMPWLDPERMLPYNVWHFIQPWLLFIVPGTFISGALFFMGGALSKRLLFVFVQGIALLVLYLIALGLTSKLDNRTLSALIDPIGLLLTNIVSQYWTVTEQNTQLFGLEGLLLYNRLIWMAVAVAALGATYVFFKTTAPKTRTRKGKKAAPATDLSRQAARLALPEVTLDQGWRVNLRRVLSLSQLYFKEVVRSVPFIAIAVMGLILLIANSFNLGSAYGTDTYPTTFLMLGQLSGFTLFFLIIIVFYTGELVWRERDVRINLIYDALPMSDAVGLIAKFLGLMQVHLVLLFALMLTGMAIQTAYGYFEYQIPVYVSWLLTQQLASLLLFTLLGLFIHVMVNQKFLGHAVIVLFFILTDVVGELGLEHSLWQFASGSMGTFSDMNQFGHFPTSFSWHTVYWLGLAGFLFATAITFAVRGTDSLLKTRVKLAGLRLVRPLLIFGSVAIVAFASSGFYIYYNTIQLNEYSTSDEAMDLQADYEKTLKQYEDLAQPRIVATDLTVDIYPSERDFTVEGYYVLKNKTTQPISDLHIQHPSQAEMHITDIRFTRLDSLRGTKASITQGWETFEHYIYTLDRPLLPGDSLRMDFKGKFETLGFREGSDNSVVYNGTFFNNQYFPSLGYESSVELGDDDERRKRDLPKKNDRGRPRTDSVGRRMNLIGDDADNIRFAITMSTSPDQIAIAPGYLQREWTEGDRRYFRYEMDVPMFNFYAMISARYEVIREKWETPHGQPVNLEIYYHAGHAYNLDRMMQGMKDALAYYDQHFSPYQFRQMRIMEFPRYASFAQSFANTVPFSEGIGFILDIEEDDVDMAYYVTAHEMAHQWWGHQVSEANVKGSAAISETLSQYSALMVMKRRYPAEMMQKFLKYELDQYLRGRSGETKKENPLAEVAGQSYIHYRKGSVVMYALQDYIGEDSINLALARFIDKWAFREDLYPTTIDLIEELRAVTPDSLQYLITDTWEVITLYENRVKEATYEPVSDDQYRITLDLSTIKYRADSLGNETKIDFNEWIDVGVYGETAAGKDTLLYLQKHRFDQEETELSLTVSRLPTKAGIDPIYKLIDRNSGDNVKAVEKE